MRLSDKEFKVLAFVTMLAAVRAVYGMVLALVGGVVIGHLVAIPTSLHVAALFLPFFRSQKKAPSPQSIYRVPGDRVS